MITVLIEVQPSRMPFLPRADITFTDEDGSVTDTGVYIQQPVAGWTTMTGWPASPEIAGFLDVLVKENADA